MSKDSCTQIHHSTTNKICRFGFFFFLIKEMHLSLYLLATNGSSDEVLHYKNYISRVLIALQGETHLKAELKQISVPLLAWYKFN